MSYQIGKTVIRNFMAFDDAEFDFSLPGLTVVEGRITGMAGCDSNGSGKSALIEAPVWALTGRTIRERCKGDDVIRNDVREGCMVEVNVVGGEQEIRVVRYRGDRKHGNKVFLFVDGEDVSRGTSAQTDIAIEQTLGLDYTTFLNTVAFGARSDVRSFFVATDADRKRIMDRMLGLEVYGRAHAVAKGRIRTQQQALDPLMTRHMEIGFVLQEKRKTIEALKSAAAPSAAEVREAEASVKGAEAELAKLLKRHQTVDEQLEAAKASQASADRRARAGYEEARNVVEASVRKLEKEHGAKLASVEVCDDLIERFESLDGDCPTCLQEVPRSKSKKIIAEETEKRDRLKKEAAALRKKIDAVVYPKPVKVDDKKLRAAQETFDESEAEVSDARGKVSAAKARLNEIRASEARSTGSIKKVQAEISDLQVELDANLEKQSAIKKQIDLLEFWVQAFGNGGIKSFVIESELETINQLATKFARRLLGDGVRVVLSATKQLKSKDEEREEMVVDAKIPGCAQSYANASKGQKHRLDLALILAFRAVVAARSVGAFAQLFADELFDGVDETGVDTVVEIIREIADGCPVVLVTHDVRLKSVGDRRVVVVHDGVKARLK